MGMSRWWWLGLLGWNALTAAEQTATLLIYQVREPGLEPYLARLIATPRYLRLDDGLAEGGYVLFDRASRTVYSVAHGDRSVLELKPRPIATPAPLPLERQVQAVAEGGREPPAVMGRIPRHQRLLVNGETCLDLVTIDGVAADVQVAQGEYRAVLAGEQARILPRVPADLHDPCDLALNIYHPDWQLGFGLPIQEWDPLGHGRALLDVQENYQVDDSLLTLPAGYAHYTPDAP